MQSGSETETTKILHWKKRRQEFKVNALCEVAVNEALTSSTHLLRGDHCLVSANSSVTSHSYHFFLFLVRNLRSTLSAASSI